MVEYTKDKTDYEVYSVRSGIYLKDTTAYNRYKGLNRTYGITFENEKDNVQKKMYLKDLLKLCEVVND
ncbi:MAG: hypothetical protein RSD14_05500 [Clostridia bacterium]